MAYPLEARHILGCLSTGLRVAIIYEQEDLLAEYHFIKERLDAEGNYMIACVYYSSQSPDPLKASGAKLPLYTFDSILVQRDYYYVGSKKFMRKSMHALPYDWYLCFEHSPETRIKGIYSDVEKGKKLGEELQAERERRFRTMLD